MPRSQFILCAQSISVDQDTNTLSVFHVMEGLNIFMHDGQIQEHKPPDFDPKAILSTLNFRVIAVWMREEKDSEKDEYDYEFLIHAPGEIEKRITSGIFRFKSIFQRFQLHILREKPWAESGLVKVISKINKRPSEESSKKWDQRSYQQEFCFPVTVAHLAKQEPEQPDVSLN